MYVFVTDYCGEQALLSDARRGATVVATVDTTCLVLNQAAFQKILKDSNVRFAKRDAKRNAISAELLEEYKVCTSLNFWWFRH